jgi:hypothetical protein
MSANMAKQGGRVQLEQSDMRLALSMAKVAPRGFSWATTEETRHLIKKHQAVVREVRKWTDGFSGHKNVKAAMVTHMAMLWNNHPDSSLSCQCGTAQKSHTHWRLNGMGALLPDQLRQLRPEHMPCLPRTPSVPFGYAERAHISEFNGVPPSYVYIRTPVPWPQLFNPDEYSKDR